MSKIRIYQLAKELNIDSTEVIEKLEELGFTVKNHMSAIEDLDALKIRKQYLNRIDKNKEPVKAEKVSASIEKKEEKTGAKNQAPKKPRKLKDYSKKTKKSAADYKKQSKREEVKEEKEMKILLPAEITIAEFANLLEMDANELIMKLISEYNLMVNMNSNLDLEIVEFLAEEYGYEVEKTKTEAELNEAEFEFEDDSKDLQFRAPVVTVMGHVDHGKTSLLDAIRNTAVTDGEAGGITQHIGASEIKFKEKKIVFLDTPGHEAFTTLRARGAKVTDLAILVVAADDGVMPQTIEAIDHAKAAGVTIIVAINKIDKVNAQPDKVKQELSEHGVLIEEWGGDIIAVEVSAIKGTGIDSLLDTILLVAEMEELKANPSRLGLGTIIEANLDRGKGPVASVLVQNGTLRVGDPIFAGKTYGKIKAMYNDKGKKIKIVGPSSAVKIMGFNQVPVAGNKFYATGEDKKARLHAERNIRMGKDAAIKSARKNVSLEDLFDQIKDGDVRELNIIIKADAYGSIEALKQSLEKLSTEEVRINIIHSQVGAVTESDILLGVASNAIIIAFNVRPNSNITSLAEREEVEIRTYRIIYETVKDIKDALSGLLEPELKEIIEGKIQVRATFRVPSIGVIAGGYVQDGKISRNSKVRLIRDDIIIYDGKISSLKRFKDDAKEVLTGFECGIGLENYDDIKENDIIETYYIKEIERTLD